MQKWNVIAIVSSSLHIKAERHCFNPVGITVVQPKKKPKGGELTVTEKARNQKISLIRIRVEHVISSVKGYRIVKTRYAIGNKVSALSYALFFQYSNELVL